MNAGEIDLDGRRLEIAWWGSGDPGAPTLVLLHEGLGCVELWRDVPQRLADATGLPVFAWSRFGYGRSGPTALPRPLSYMQDEADQVLPRLLDAAGIGPAILIGHSDGASIAAIHAGSAPRELRGVVLIAPHFFVEDLNIASIEQIRTDYRQGDLRRRLARYHADPDMAFYGWCDAWLDPAFRDFDIVRCLPGIAVPILALQGSDDPYGSDEQLRVLERNARAPLEIRRIAGARHSPQFEAAEKTLAAITAFVHRIATAAATP